MGEVVSLLTVVGASSSGAGPYRLVWVLIAPVYDCPFKPVRDSHGLKCRGRPGPPLRVLILWAWNSRRGRKIKRWELYA
ncbi:hypothetical protein AVEN_79441-1 [Araneus ventricosus]|uniref:Uncharacterized protein n=1 Tax=Araneus ventricosus TaxID=182803 RepID=A0A4Y2I2G6_ARAVE|nr:hypothetical protein AVEN_79441-1 [Araneus ventricosus]